MRKLLAAAVAALSIAAARADDAARAPAAEKVPPAQAEAIVAALAANGIPHAYIAFEGESHGFRKAENIVASLEAELSFYGQIMGFTPPGVPPVPLEGG